MDPFGMEMQCNLSSSNGNAGAGGADGAPNQSPSPLGAVRTNLVSPVEAVATGMLPTATQPLQQPFKPVMSSPSTPNDPELQHEKTDCTPENSKKSDGDTPVDAPDGARAGVVAAGAEEKGVSLQDMLKGKGVASGGGDEEPSTKEASTEASVAESVRNAFAFTIDFGDGRKAVDSQRHEKMLERFQARHRRGESLSKLESSSGARQTVAAAPSPFQHQHQQQRVPQSVNLPRRNRALATGVDSGEQQPMMPMEVMMVDVSGGRPVAVKLREKNQRSVGRDQVPGKRHSWSPRTSVNEAVMTGGGAPNQRDAVATGGTPKGVNKQGASGATTKGRFAPKSTTLALALEQQQQQVAGMKDSSCSSSEFNAESMDSSGGIPCLEAPLENFRTAKGDGDEVSETGTYTLDGDNYTEEQKERMNIDRISGSGAAAAPVIAPGPTDRPVRPTAFREELEVIDLERLGTGAPNTASDTGHNKPAGTGATAPEKRKHNILEISYFHEPAITAPSAGADKDRTKAKQSYMEKLKSRMKNIAQGGKASHDRKQCLVELESPDQGTFTSVTTSGILSLKPTLEDNPKVVARRRNSLSKSHIDSSEYVQGVAKLNIHGTETEETHPAPGDQLLHLEHKILNCYTDSEKAQQHGMLAHGSPQATSGQSGETRHRKTPSDVAALTSVTSKKDWIQEWAKNAREFSKTTSPKVHPHEPPTVPAYGRPGVEIATGGVPPSMVRSYGGETTNHPRNQFGYDYDIDMAKSDYYESARKYEEFGDNLDHRREQQHQQQQLPNFLRGSSGARRGPPHTAGSGIISPPNETMNEFTRAGSRGSMRRYAASGSNNPSPVGVSSVSVASKPPMSPSKIPSPIGSIGRTRSLSRNRSLQGSNSDLSGNETEMYLQKTAAAISTLQNLQRRNSMRNSSSHHSSSPLSPASRKMSPKVSPMNSLHSPLDSPSAIYPLEKTLGGSYVTNGSNSPHYSPQHLNHQQQQQQLQRHLHHQLHQSVGASGHKRNHSLDGTTPDELGSPLHAASYLANGGGGGGALAGHMTRSLNTANTSPKMDLAKRNHAHARHNSYEGVMSSLPPKPIKCFQQYDQPNVTGYYATEEGSGGGRSGGAVVDEGELDDCADYDEEEFEEDIDDDVEEEELVDREEHDRRRIFLGDQTAPNAMPRPRAMSLEPRRATQSAAMQSHKTQNIHPTGAKQALAGMLREAGGGGAGVTTRAQIRAQRTVASAGQQQQQQQQQQPQHQQHLTSPIKRSSSFSVKQTVVKPTTPTLSAKGTTPANDRRPMGGSKIQKSASSTSFKKMMAMDNVQPQQYHHHAVQPPHHRHQLVMDPNYPDELMLYINDDGDDDGLQLQIGGDRQAAGGYSSNSLTDEEDDDDDDDDEGELLDEEDDSGIRMEKEPLTNTRYNKTFLMRMEQNKKIAAGATRPDQAPSNAGKQTTTAAAAGGGAAACPNTPELPRRAAAARMGALGRDRASMPRDSSLNRMKQDLNMRKSSAGRDSLLGGKGNQQQLSSQSIASTVSSAALPSAGAKVQPKYLDISKYKSSNAANFLKKDESKSYLLRQEGVRKSPSSASVSSAMSRTDPTRMSARSIRSASSATGSKSSGTGGSASTAAAKKDPVKIAKEQELEMWRRRASYDPMKAALEGKKKQLEEAKRIAAQQQQQQQQQLSERQSKSNESSVLRSQSYHSGVVNIGGGARLYQGSVSNSSNANLRGAAYNQSSALGDPNDCDVNNRWTLTSTESSEDLDGDYYIN